MELVTKLVELKLIEVLYTSDGKEYLTPQHLAKEIRDELTVHGGLLLRVCVCVRACVCVCVCETVHTYVTVSGCERISASMKVFM